MKRLFLIFIFFPVFGFGQINDNWDAVKVGTDDISKIYVGVDLVWEKTVGELTFPTVTAAANYTFDDSDNQSITITIPHTVSVGDFIVIGVIATDGTAHQGLTTEGYTLQGSLNESNYSEIDIYSKVATSSDIGDDITFNFSNLSHSVYNGVVRITALEAGGSPSIYPIESGDKLTATGGANAAFGNVLPNGDNSYILIYAAEEPDGYSNGVLYDDSVWGVWNYSSLETTAAILGWSRTGTTAGVSLGTFSLGSESGVYTSGIVVEVKGY